MINPYDIYHRLNQLKTLRKEAPIDDFLWAFDEFMRTYTEEDEKFDPDAYFPRKVQLNAEVNAIYNNIDTLEILTRKNHQRSDFACNIDNIKAAVCSIRSLEWVKKPDTYIIDASRISEWERVKLKKKLQDSKLIFKEREDPDDET